MKLLKRIKFAVNYQFEPEFVVIHPDSGGVRFLRYEDAKKFADKSSEYALNVFVAVRKV